MYLSTQLHVFDKVVTCICQCIHIYLSEQFQEFVKVATCIIYWTYRLPKGYRVRMNYFETQRHTLIIIINNNYPHPHHHNQAKAGLRPARPRMDHRARIQFCGVLNQQNYGNQPKTMKNHETTLKNHGNQPKTMKNHETTLKTMETNQKP